MQYMRISAVGTQITECLLPPSNNVDNVNHFLTSVTHLFVKALENVSDSDMVGMIIQNQLNLNNKPTGISFRQNDKLSGDVIWSVFETEPQSNSRFNALDTLVVNEHSLKIPVGFGVGIKTIGRPLSVMAHQNYHRN